MQGEPEIPFVDHDYAATAGDRLLSLIKRLVPSPEARHRQLANFAKWAPFVPFKPLPKIPYGMRAKKPLERVIRFSDKSNPLYLNCPIILAAGGNKEGTDLAAYANIGFGGVSVGTATRVPREGNPFRPRIRMLNADRAIQNSMGLNNPGIDVVAKRVDSQFGAARKRELAVGLSIAETPGLQDEEERLDDVIYSFRKAYNVAEYVEINLSCPNTGHQRIDAQLKYLDRVLQSVMHIRSSIPVRKAVYAKLSPDLGERQLQALLELVTQHNINGLVLFNTFPGARSEFLEMQTRPDALKPVRQDGDLGGLSGRPLYVNTFRAVEYIKNRLPDKSIIAVGGIDHGAKVFDLLRMGADAVQMYSALSYRWFAARRMQAELYECLEKSGCSTLSELLDGERP